MFNSQMLPIPMMGGFNPTNISGLQLWLDGSDISTLFQDSAKTTPVTSDGDVVGAWADKSGNSKDALQATTANKPLYKTAIQNGKSLVRFDGTDDKLATASIAHGIGTGNLYVACVFRGNGVFVNAWQNIWANGTYAPGLYMQGATGQVLTGYFGSERNFNNRILTGFTYLIEFWRDTGVFKAAIDTVQESNTFSIGTSVANAIQQIGYGGASGYGHLDLCELVFYANFPSGDVATLRDYFNNKWAVY